MYKLEYKAKIDDNCNKTIYIYSNLQRVSFLHRTPFSRLTLLLEILDICKIFDNTV